MGDNLADGRLSASGVAEDSVGLRVLTYKNGEHNHIPRAYFSSENAMNLKVDFMSFSLSPID